MYIVLPKEFLFIAGIYDHRLIRNFVIFYNFAEIFKTLHWLYFRSATIFNARIL